MTDVYKKLASKLNEMPNTFPSTESQIELRILQNLFTASEAEIALRLGPLPETIEAIAERLGRPLEEAQAILDNMVKKGQVGYFKQAGQDLYVLLPFVMGMAEASQVNRVTKEFADLFAQYSPHLVPSYGRLGPAEARVVPVVAEINQQPHIHRYEDVRRIIEEGQSFDLLECFCRQLGEAAGRPCTHTKETCLHFSKEKDAFAKHRFGREITKQEALEVLERAEEEGLVHVTDNVEEGHFFVCNCCPCCCGFLRGLKDFGAPHVIAKSNFMAVIESASCTACGICAHERCPVNAIVEENETYQALAQKCIGCGVCVPSCPTGSIKLAQRPESEQNQPPADMLQLYFDRVAARGIEVRLD